MKTDFTTPEDSSKGFLDPFMIWWSLFSESKIKAKLASWTNKRVAQKLAKLSESSSNSNNRRVKKKQPTFPKWKNIDETLLMIVFAIKLKMGEFSARNGPRQQRFWKKPKRRGQKDLGVPIIRDSIGRDVFFRIMRNITTYNPSNKPSFAHDDNGYKGSWLWEQLSLISKRFWTIDDQACVDERMIDCKGRWLSKYRIDRKKHNIGLKLLLLCNKQGYIFHAFLWTQKYRMKLQKYADLSVGSQIVMSFIDDCQLQWRDIFADNFFISYAGALAALKKNVFIAGTTRKNSAGLPHSMLNNIGGSELESGQHIHCLNNKDPVVAIGIQDGTTFFKMISTLRVMPFAETKRVLKKRKLTESGEYQTKPVCIINDKYLDYMGGVDAANQVCEKFGCNTKTLKWTSHNLFGFLDATVAQAITIYNNTTAKLDGYNKITKQQFLDQLITNGLDAMAAVFIGRYSKWKSTHREKDNWEDLKETRYRPEEIKCCKRLLKERKNNKTAR